MSHCISSPLDAYICLSDARHCKYVDYGRRWGIAFYHELAIPRACVYGLYRIAAVIHDTETLCLVASHMAGNREYVTVAARGSRNGQHDSGRFQLAAIL